MNSNKNQKTKKTAGLVISGVAVLAFSNIVVKIIGLLFKVPMHSILGDMGMGYFNAAYEVYKWFYTLSTAGLPIAVSVFVAESRAKRRYNQTKKILRVTLLLFIIVGITGTAVMIVFASLFAGIAGSPHAAPAIICLAPTLFFICVASAYRGYFQGHQYMTPTAVSQIIETAGKLIIGIVFAKFAYAKYVSPLLITFGSFDKIPEAEQAMSLSMVAAYAIVGLTIGVAAGTVYLWVTKLLFKEMRYNGEYAQLGHEDFNSDNNRVITNRLVKIAIPITISSSVMSLSSLLDLLLIANRLESAGFGESARNALYGNYTTLCVSMFNLPPVFVYPVAYAIVPLISSAIAQKNKDKLVRITNSSLKVASLIAFPCALGMCVLSEPILKLLYEDQSAITAAPLLSVLSIGVIFISLLAITNSILQASNNEKYPIYSMLCGAAVKLVSSYFLIGNPDINIMGAPVGTLFCYIAAAGINFIFVSKSVNIVPSFGKVFFRPFIASVLCAATGLGAYNILSSAFGESGFFTLAAIGASGLVYIIAIFLIQAVDREDLMLLPKGKKICALFERLHLLKA